jgi:hypothetical protein
MKGMHDDSIMSMSMALYAGDISFSQLQKSDSKNKAMIDSWVMSERTYEPAKTHYSYGSSFDQIGAMGMDTNNIYHKDNPTNVPKDSYKEHMWLFGRSK